MRTFETGCRLLATAVADRVCPAASVQVGTSDRTVWAEAFGSLTYESNAAAASTATVFDLASLTKVIATTTIAMRLCESGVIDLATPVTDWVREWAGADRSRTALRDLLEHCSGLPAWAALYQHCHSSSEFRAAIGALPLDYAPRTTSIYSDLGFMVAGWALEAAGGKPIDQLLAEVLPSPSAAAEDYLTFVPPIEWRPRIAPTRVDAWRGRLLVGEVDDDNAWALGGVAGHAGLFGTAGAVGRFARSVLLSLGGGREGRPGLARNETMAAFLTPSAVPGSSRACGWDLMRPTSSCGTRMSAAAFGHTGFTGSSLWIDPRRDLYVVLLTNRVHPDGGSNEAIQRLRRDVHDAVIESWDCA